MMVPEATCLRISGIAALSRGTMNGKRAAQDLAEHNDDLALSGLFLGKSPIAAILGPVLRFDVPAKICAVDLYGAGELGFVRVVNLRAHRLAELVREHERRLVLNIEIPPKLKGGDALQGVDEQRDGGEVITDRQLAGMEERPARHGELPTAFPAPPDRPAPKTVHLGAPAMWAIGLSAVVRPPDLDEPCQRFLIVHPHDLSEGQASCG